MFGKERIIKRSGYDSSLTYERLPEICVDGIFKRNAVITTFLKINQVKLEKD